MRPTIHEMTLISRFARALEALSDAQLRSSEARIAAYPVIPLMAELYLHWLDAHACHAERTRRALRVGRGFEQMREAA